MEVEGYTILGTPEHFRLYKEAIDLRGWDERLRPYSFRHYGEPTEYPAAVETSIWDDPNGPYSCSHSFTYLSEVEALYSALRAVKAELDAVAQEVAP